MGHLNFGDVYRSILPLNLDSVINSPYVPDDNPLICTDIELHVLALDGGHLSDKCAG